MRRRVDGILKGRARGPDDFRRLIAVDDGNGNNRKNDDASSEPYDLAHIQSHLEPVSYRGPLCCGACFEAS